MAIDPLTAGFELGGKIIDKLFPNPEDRAAAQLKLIELQQNGDLAQIAVNTEEAKSDSLFVSGGRPFIIWVCGIAFAYKFIMQPFLIFLLVASGSKFDYHLLPVLDWSEMSPVLLGLLGLGGLRTVEKVQDMKTKLPWQK